MVLKADKSMEEVWEIKDLVYNDLKSLSWDEYNEYFTKDIKRVMEKYGIKYRNKAQNDIYGKNLKLTPAS